MFAALFVLCLTLTLAPTATGAPGSLTSNVRAGIGGESLTFTGSVPPKTSRPVELQRKSGTKWIKVTSSETSSTGKFWFSTKVRSATTTYRVYARTVTIGTKKYGAVATPTRKISTQVQKGALTAPISAKQGAVLTLVSVFTPARFGRPVVLQTKVGQKWVQVATGKQGSKGTTRFTINASVVGSFTYRAVAANYRGAAAIGTPAKKITVTAAPSPVLVPGDVTVRAGDQSVVVSWSAVPEAADYRVYQSTSADGGWTLVPGSPMHVTTLTADGLTNATQYWFRVAALDAHGVEGPFSVPVSAVPDMDPPPPSATTLIDPHASTKVSTGEFTATVPAGSVSNTGVAMTVTPLPQGTDGLPGVDVHIHGAWDPSAGGVTVSGPFPTEPGMTPVVFHEHEGHLQLFTGSQVAVTGSTAAVTLDTLSSTYFGATVCTKGGPASVICSGSNYNGWADYVEAMKAKAVAELYAESKCGEQFMTEKRTARTWGATPFGIACTTSPTSGGAVTWKFQNVNHGSVGVANTGVVYVHDEQGGTFTNGRVADPDAAGIKATLAGQLGTRVIVPGDSLTITKAPNSGETTVNVHADVIATTMWHGVGDILALLNKLVPTETLNTLINGCGVKVLYDTPTSDKKVAELAMSCVKDAAAALIKEELAATTDPSKKLNLATAKIALFWLHVGEYATDWAFAIPAVEDHLQTLRNYDRVSPPTDRGSNDYIARDPSSGRAVWVSNDTRYAIPNEEDYLCLAKSRLVWDIGGLESLDTPPASWSASGCQTAPRALWDYKPTAEGGNTGVNVILRNPTGNAWLVNANGELQHIPDGGTYLCLAAANPVIWNVPNTSTSAWREIGPPATCGSTGPGPDTLSATVTQLDNNYYAYVLSSGLKNDVWGILRSGTAAVQIDLATHTETLHPLPPSGEACNGYTDFTMTPDGALWAVVCDGVIWRKGSGNDPSATWTRLAELAYPFDPVPASDNSIWINDGSGSLTSRRMTPDGTVTTISRPDPTTHKFWSDRIIAPAADGAAWGLGSYYTLENERRQVLTRYAAKGLAEYFEFPFGDSLTLRNVLPRPDQSLWWIATKASDDSVVVGKVDSDGVFDTGVQISDVPPNLSPGGSTVDHKGSLWVELSHPVAAGGGEISVTDVNLVTKRWQTAETTNNAATNIPRFTTSSGGVVVAWSNQGPPLIKLSRP